MEFKFRVFTDLPSHKNLQLDQIINVAKLAENYHYDGVLIYFNHQTIDPIVLNSLVLQHTSKLIPLIAVQPYYISPIQMARVIESSSLLFNRKLYLNMVTGADPSELNQMQNNLKHADRYKRVVEYIEVLKSLLMSDKKITYKGEYYDLNHFPPCKVPSESLPKIFLSGSSAASIEASFQIADVAVSHPEPVELFGTSPIMELRGRSDIGIRIGIITRETKEEAWRVARSRFKVDPKSLVAARMKLRSESTWNKTLAGLALNAETYDEVYWLGSYLSGEAAPALVGDYNSVSAYLEKYLDLGVNTLLIDPWIEEDFFHIDKVFNHFKND